MEVVVGMHVRKALTRRTLQHPIQTRAGIHAFRDVVEPDARIIEPAHDFRRPIRGVVDDPELPIGIVLVQNALHCLHDEPRLVVGRHQEQKRHTQSLLGAEALTEVCVCHRNAAFEIDLRLPAQSEQSR